MRWSDSDDERAEYLQTMRGSVPYTSGMWGQHMFTLKYTSCEDPTREGCGCTAYAEEYQDEKGFSGIEYARGSTWNEIMCLSDEDMLSNEKVDIYM